MHQQPKTLNQNKRRHKKCDLIYHITWHVTQIYATFDLTLIIKFICQWNSRVNKKWFGVNMAITLIINVIFLLEQNKIMDPYGHTNKNKKVS